MYLNFARQYHALMPLIAFSSALDVIMQLSDRKEFRMAYDQSHEN